MLSGSLVALVTPYKSDLEVDYTCLKELVYLHLVSGTDGIVVLGSTGEHLLLSEAEQHLITKCVVEEVWGEIPVIVNVGVASTRESLRNAERAKVLGADALMVVVPYYVKPEESGLIAHYEALSKIGLPIMLYHHPGRTGTRLSTECVERILQIPNLVAVKDATNDLIWAKGLPAAVFAADDAATFDVMQAGGKGVISVVANLFPKEWAECVHSQAGFEQFNPLLEALALESNPQCIKYAMSLVGLCNPFLRLPLMEPSEKTKAAIQTAMSNSFTCETIG